MRFQQIQVLILAIIAACLTSLPLMAATKEEDALWSAIQTLKQQLDAVGSIIEEEKIDQYDHNSTGKTTIGGYGEMHYNNLDSNTQMDFHRAVLFIGHAFNENIRFFTEWDLEHVFKMELEQAYLEFDLNDQQRISTGVILMPIGIINETHEPPVFYGVERNPIETKIIPTTWREGGVSLAGNMANGLSYDLLLTTGLDATKIDYMTPNYDADDVKVSIYDIRKGRQHVAKANAENLATTARIKWTGMPGVELAASLHLQDNITQGFDSDASATLIEAHTVINRGPVTIKALYARWNINGAGAQTAGKDEQSGWYIEPSYKLNAQLGIFARYNVWDNEAGSSSTTDTEYTQTEIGANFWPHEDVVIKVDYMQKDKAGVSNDKGFNLGIGYHF